MLPMESTPFSICSHTIRQDEAGRYCLNDLHEAFGGEDRHSPNRWTRSKQYKELVGELTPNLAFAPSDTQRGGSSPGTYVCKELVYAYAMWISPKFHLQVIRTFDAVVQAQLKTKDEQYSRLGRKLDQEDFNHVCDQQIMQQQLSNLEYIVADLQRRLIRTEEKAQMLQDNRDDWRQVALDAGTYLDNLRKRTTRH